MATTSQLLSDYIKKTSSQISSSLQQSQQQRFDVIKDIVKEEKTSKKPSVSSILRELKAKEELDVYLQAKKEKNQIGFSGTTQQYLNQKKSDAEKEIKIREEKTKAEEAVIFGLDEDIAVLEKKAEAKSEQRQEAYDPQNIEMGQLPDFVLNNKPNKKLTINDANDIPFYSNVFQEPKGGFSENNFYATPQKIQEFIDSGVLERNGINLNDAKYKFNIIDVKVGDVTRKVIDINDTPSTREAFQTLMFDIFEKDAGIREFYNINVKESFGEGDFIIINGIKYPTRTKTNTTPPDSTRVQ